MLKKMAAGVCVGSSLATVIYAVAMMFLADQGKMAAATQQADRGAWCFIIAVIAAMVAR